jgi:vacuolar-type H+-ATPase subunit F/Vma7
MTGMAAVMAVGAMNMVDGMRAAGAQVREAYVHQSYADALTQAQNYAYEVAAIAEAAVARVAELQAEVASLRAACRQRQQIIDSFRKVA